MTQMINKNRAPEPESVVPLMALILVGAAGTYIGMAIIIVGELAGVW